MITSCGAVSPLRLHFGPSGSGEGGGIGQGVSRQSVVGEAGPLLGVQQEGVGAAHLDPVLGQPVPQPGHQPQQGGGSSRGLGLLSAGLLLREVIAEDTGTSVISGTVGFLFNESVLGKSFHTLII